MRIASSSIFALLSLTFIGASNAEDNPNFESLQRAEKITCTFEHTVKSDLKDGRLVIQQTKEKSEMVFEAIDFRGGKARLVSTGGTLNAFLTHGGATFMEGPGFDNHSFTTVFPVASSKAGELVAVESVHALIPGIRLKIGAHFYTPEQKYGSCKVRP